MTHIIYISAANFKQDWGGPVGQTQMVFRSLLANVHPAACRQEQKPDWIFLVIRQERIIFPLCQGRGCRDARRDGGALQGPPSPHSPMPGYHWLCCTALMGFRQGTGSRQLSHAGSPEMGKRVWSSGRKHPVIRDGPNKSSQSDLGRPWAPQGSISYGYCLLLRGPQGTPCHGQVTV